VFCLPRRLVTPKPCAQAEASAEAGRAVCLLSLPAAAGESFRSVSRKFWGSALPARRGGSVTVSMREGKMPKC